MGCPKQVESCSMRLYRTIRSRSSAPSAEAAPRSKQSQKPRNGVCFAERGSPRGWTRARFSFTRLQHSESAASMQETTEQPTLAPEAVNGLSEAPAPAQEWAGEPFLRADEDPAVVLAPGTARRLALDDAVEEMDGGQSSPSYEWKRRYALMLGLERVLSDRPPHLASGTELRRHQIDALAGMLTELIAAAQAHEANGEANGDANGYAEVEEDEDDELDDATVAEVESDEQDLPLSPEEDPGAVRRFRFRHPTASGKTIAAAGFVEAARTLRVLILTHRRLLVSQFNRDLTSEGYGERLVDAVERGEKPSKQNPLTIQTYAWFARHW